MALIIRQNATHKVLIGPVVAVANGYVPVTTLALSTADEAEVILHDNGTVVDISAYTFAAITTADGYYHLTLQSGISSTIGHMTVVINDDSLCLPVRTDFIVVEEVVYDALYASAATGYNVGKTGYTLTATTGLGNQTADITGTVSTVTTLTNLPAITANWLTAAGTAADFTTEIQAGLATAADLTAVKTKTDFLPSVVAGGAGGVFIAGTNAATTITTALTTTFTGNLTGSVGSLAGHTPQTGDSFARIGATGSGLTSLASQASVNIVDDFIDTEIAALTTELAKVPKSDGTATWNVTALASLQAEATDALNAYDPPTNAEMEARTPTAAQLAYIIANAATGLPVTFTTAGGSTTVAVLNQVDGAAASATNDQYKGRLLVFTDGTLKGVVTDITGYVGSTTTATITAIPFAPTASHNARLI